MSVNCLAVWRATMVHRWHANPDLAGSGDTTGAHSGRVALLISLLFPDCSKALVVVAIKHDLGEDGVGDVAGPAKRADPVLKAAIDRAEVARLQSLGVEFETLTPDELRILKFVDRLDSFLWMRFRAPYLEHKWDNTISFVRSEGEALGIGADCGGLL